MMMDNGMDSRANGNEYVDCKVRAGLYAIGLCRKALERRGEGDLARG